MSRHELLSRLSSTRVEKSALSVSRCSYSTTGLFTISQKTCNVSFHSIVASPETLAIDARIHLC